MPRAKKTENTSFSNMKAKKLRRKKPINTELMVDIKPLTPSQEKAYDFLDAWLDDASAAHMLNEWGYGHTNKDVMATVGKENGWGPLSSYTEGSLFQKPSDPKLRERMIKEFELIKSGF